MDTVCRPALNPGHRRRSNRPATVFRCPQRPGLTQAPPLSAPDCPHEPSPGLTGLNSARRLRRWLCVLATQLALVPGMAGAQAQAPSGDEAAQAPAYATRLPPAVTLRYGLRSGLLSGRGSLRWQPDALAGYTLSLEGTVLGISALSQGSRGGLGEHGLMPDHFVDARRGRAPQTLHFDAAARQIRFSAGAPPLAWRARAQDRLSWMLQLTAVAAANPALMRPGAAPVGLFVVGARGDADLWAFQTVAVADIPLPAGPVSAALHLRRLPRTGGDTQVDVWLDPARHHLPVRMRMADGDGGQTFELRLEGYAEP